VANTRKVRKRYIAFEVVDEKSAPNVQKLIIFLKKEQAGKFRVVFYDERLRRGLVQCGHLDLEKVRGIISKSEDFRILGVSGTIKAAKRKFLAKR